MPTESKPSDFCKKQPMSSVFQKSENETVATNIMRILKRTGDTFRELSPEEYTKERKKDGHFTALEMNYFDEVIRYCKDAKSARKFAPSWAKL